MDIHLNRFDMDAPLPPIRGRYGPWLLNLDNLTLELECGRYYVDLEDCNTSAKTLDWIMQVAGKTWASPTLVGWLVKALDDVMDVQSCLCSHGKNKTINPTKHIKNRIASRGVSARAENQNQ